MDRSATYRNGLLGLAVASLLGGCQGAQLAEERDALWNENEQLRSELANVTAERDAAVNERARLETEVARLQGELAAARSAPAPVAVVPSGFEGIEGVETEQGGGLITVRVPGDILFESGKIELKTSARKTLDEIAGVIQQRYAGKTIRVIGYTDTDPIRKSGWQDNLELSLQRAAAVHRALQQQGVEPKDLDAVGRGEWHPKASKAKSRRVEIVVVMSG